MLNYAREMLGRPAAGGGSGVASSLGVTWNSVAGGKSVTATPAVNNLIVVIGGSSFDTIGNMSVTDNQGGTYTLVGSATKRTSGDAVGIWVRTSLVAAAVSTIYTLSTGGANDGSGLVVLAISGMTKTGATAARQFAKQDNQAAATPAPTFAASCLSSSVIIGAVYNATNPATMTPPASYTELHDVGYLTSTNGLEVASRNNGETGNVITWGSASASAFCSMAVELDTSP